MVNDCGEGGATFLAVRNKVNIAAEELYHKYKYCRKGAA